MNASDLRNKSIDQLKSELYELLREQFNLRMQKTTPGAVIKSNIFKQVRRDIARIKTIFREKVMNNG